MNLHQAYQQLQAAWIKEHNVEVGDKVKVVRRARNREYGWGSYWDPCKDKFVGRTLPVGNIGSFGIHLEGWAFPVTCLEFVEKGRTDSKTISLHLKHGHWASGATVAGGTDVTAYRSGDIAVGCQDVCCIAVEKIIALRKEVMS